MSEGWVKIPRKILEQPFFKKAKYVQVWVYLVLSANHQDKKTIFNFQTITIKKGQLLTGRDKISEKTGIHRSSIERILKYLENEHLIEQQKNNKFRLITIKDFNDEEKNEQQNEQPVSIQRATNEQPVSTNKNEENDKNSIYIYTADENFSKSFKAFKEMRKSKKAVMTAYAEDLILQKLHKHDLPMAVEALNRSVENGWTGVWFPEDKQKNDNRGSPASVYREQIGRLHDGTRVKKIKGEWRDYDNPFTINLSPSYYPEILNDSVMTEEEWLQKNKSFSQNYVS